METDVQQAIDAEKTFNNRNLLLVTFIEEEVNTNTFKQLHRSVHEVHLLQPEFSPKCRYIIEVKDLFDIHAVKDVIMKYNFENRQVHVQFLEKFNDSYTNLDPYKLQVNNLPSTISPRELKQLYPLSTDYTFLLLECKARSVLVHFSKVQDSITAYKTTNFMQYQSNILTVKFYRKDISYKTTVQNKKRTFTDVVMESDNVNDITRWKDIQTNALKDKKISDTLLVNNLPLSTTGLEIQRLFPNLLRYKFVPEYSTTKSCIVGFRKVEDAVNMYKESDNIFKSNILQIDFYEGSSFCDTKLKDNGFSSGMEANSTEEKEDEDQNNSRDEERINRFVLHVENLPLSTNNEDILHLFPDHFRHEIISVKNQNSVSAHVCFKNAEDTIKAYNASKNILFKRNILSVKYKTKKFKKPNPFALMKRSTTTTTTTTTTTRNCVKIENLNQSKKQQKLDVPKIDNTDEIIIIDDGPPSNNAADESRTEDDVEYISEEDNFIEGNFFATTMKNGDCFLDDDDDDHDDLKDDVEFGDSILPLDDDEF